MEWGAACQSAPLEGVAGRRALEGASAGALPQGGGREAYYRYCRHHPLLALLLLVLALSAITSIVITIASILIVTIIAITITSSADCRRLQRAAPFCPGAPGRPRQRQQLGSGGDLRAAPSEGGHSGARGGSARGWRS